MVSNGFDGFFVMFAKGVLMVLMGLRLQRGTPAVDPWPLMAMSWGNSHQSGVAICEDDLPRKIEVEDYPSWVISHVPIFHITQPLGIWSIMATIR